MAFPPNSQDIDVDELVSDVHLSVAEFPDETAALCGVVVNVELTPAIYHFGTNCIFVSKRWML
jgi:hypothetical protein